MNAPDYCDAFFAATFASAGDEMSDRDIDLQLVERVRQGDQRAFGLLVEKYQRKLMRLLSRMVRDPHEVEDIAQEAFIKAYRALPQFRGDAAFYTWLYRIAVNTAKNYLSSRGRAMPTVSDQAMNDEDEPDERLVAQDISTPETELLSKQVAIAVNQAVDALPQELRQAITLREIEGMSYEKLPTPWPAPSARSAPGFSVRVRRSPYQTAANSGHAGR
jgi:RNA polymerase sigma-70 factor, ECF subfamily